MQVHVVQVAYGDDETPAARVARVADLVLAQAGADLVVLPELWPDGGFAYDAWAAGAQGLDGTVVTSLRAAAAELGATVHMGSFVERDEAGRLFNTSVLIGPTGALLATYRKIHLFGFGAGEPAVMTAGEDTVVHDTFGLATCYDLRFPEMFRALLDAGTETVLLPAAWPARRVGHWRLLVQARAVEDQVMVIACNTGGSHAGVPMGGHSMVVDPWGEVLAEAGTGEEVLVVQVDPGVVAATRAAFPVLGDRRFARLSR